MFDAYGRNIHYLRLSVTDLCNLRCRYCMPDGVPKLAHEDILTYEEFLRLAALFAQCGIDTVRITGGEPLVRRGVEQLTAGLKAIPGIRRVALTTNGVLLAQKLPALLAAGLDSVNISLDTLHPETFRRITGKDELAAEQYGIRAALASGIPVKLNCVPQPGVNEGELESLAAFAQEHPLQVRFIEMMPIGFGAGLPGLSGPELLERFYRRWPRLQPVTGAAFGDGPAVYYSAPGWRGSIGLIAAVHGKFCASCTRVYKIASTTGLRQAPRRERYVCSGSSCSEYSEAACRLPACKSALMVFRWCEMSWRMARICSYCAVRSP